MLQSINDLSRSLVALDQNTTVIAVVELSLSAWLVGGMVPGIARDPLKKLAVPDPEALLRLLHRWRDEAVKAGKTDHTHCRCVRSRPRRLLVGTVAGRPEDRSVCHSSNEYRGVTRAATGEDR